MGSMMTTLWINVCSFSHIEHFGKFGLASSVVHRVSKASNSLIVDSWIARLPFVNVFSSLFHRATLVAVKHQCGSLLLQQKRKQDVVDNGTTGNQDIGELKNDEKCPSVACATTFGE